MTKFKVIRYWDTYPDGVVAICNTEEEAEKIAVDYSGKTIDNIIQQLEAIEKEVTDED